MKLIKFPCLIALSLLASTLAPQAANTADVAVFKITDQVERPVVKVPPIGVNGYGGCGAIEWARNNFVQNIGNEPIYWRNLHRVVTSGPNWFEFDGAGTSWFELWASGFLSGADVRIYRLVDKEGKSLSDNGAVPDMSRADHVAFVGKTKILPEGSPGFPDGGWVVTKYGEVHPNVFIAWGNHSATDTAGIVNGKPYWYSVVAIGADGTTSELATEVSATPQAGADSALTQSADADM
jgi:hypothetical protein